MKPATVRLLVASVLLLALADVTVRAQTAAATNPTPPVPATPPTAPTPPASGVIVSLQPVTYLGAMTAPVPRVLSSQLGLPEGFGLVVVNVQPDSPAAEVLKTDDVIVRLDDQRLVSTEQLSVLIRSLQAGDEVALTYFRSGEEHTETVALTEQVPPPMNISQATATNLGLSSDTSERALAIIQERVAQLGIPTQQQPDMVKRLADAQARAQAQTLAQYNVRTRELTPVEPGAQSQTQEVQQQVADIRAQRQTMDEARASAEGWSVVGGTMVDGQWVPIYGKRGENPTTTFSDNAGVVTIQTKDGVRTVTVINPDGTVAYSGPFETEEQRTAVSPSVRARIEDIERRLGDRFFIPATAPQ